MSDTWVEDAASHIAFPAKELPEKQSELSRPRKGVRISSTDAVMASWLCPFLRDFGGLGLRARVKTTTGFLRQG